MKEEQFFEHFFHDARETIKSINFNILNDIVFELKMLKERNGRLIFMGVGGSAGNCSHAVNDFRKLCGIDAITPIDNVSELTARTNDEGWSTVFKEWMKVSRCNSNDVLFIFSVGGGSIEKNVSINLINAVDFAKKNGIKILGIVGKKDGYVAKKGDSVLCISPKNQKLITPISESFQSLIWHAIVSHPLMEVNKTKW